MRVLTSTSGRFAAAGVCAAACASTPSRSAPSPSQAETTVQAWSTIGWTAVPPFRRHTCASDAAAEGEDPKQCFFFTRAIEPTQRWDPAQVTGAYTLVGRWTAEEVTLEAWTRAQDADAPMPEEFDRTTAFPVFEVRSYCLSAADVKRHLQLLDEMADDESASDQEDAAQTRAWLRSHQCAPGVPPRT